MSGAARARSTSVSGLSRADGAVLRAVVAQVARQLARVDVGDADDAVARKVGVERLLRAIVRDDRALFADDEAGDLRLVVDALGVLIVDAGVADLRRGHRHDLTGVRRIGQHFLVAGHAGREHDLTDGAGIGAEGSARENGAVGEGEVGCGACSQCSSSRLEGDPTSSQGEHDLSFEFVLHERRISTLGLERDLFDFKHRFRIDQDELGQRAFADAGCFDADDARGPRARARRSSERG